MRNRKWAYSFSHVTTQRRQRWRKAKEGELYLGVFLDVSLLCYCNTACGSLYKYIN